MDRVGLIMKNKGNHNMGRFSVEIEIANYDDVVVSRSGHLDPAKIRRAVIHGGGMP